MYNKLFSKILDSSIWLEPHATRIVWLTFLAAMDDSGLAQFSSLLNLAHRARVSPQEAADAVKCLEAPDPDSANPDNEGRRIERVSGGWIILNSKEYRALANNQLKAAQTRARVAEFRAKKRESAPENGATSPD